jgi:hypothetical protein
MQMIFFAGFMMWSFNWKEYQVQPGEPSTSIWRPLWDSINLCTPSPPSSDPYAYYWRICGRGPVGDFAVEIGSELSYFARRITGRQPAPTKRSFGRAFGVESYVQVEGSNEYATSYAPHPSYGEDVQLTPYKASALDLHSSEDVDKYNPEESRLAWIYLRMRSARACSPRRRGCFVSLDSDSPILLTRYPIYL